MNTYTYCHRQDIGGETSPESLSEYSDSARQLVVVASVANALSLPFAVESTDVCGEMFADIIVECASEAHVVALLEGLRSNRLPCAGVVCGDHFPDYLAEAYADVCDFAT